MIGPPQIEPDQGERCDGAHWQAISGWAPDGILSHPAMAGSLGGMAGYFD